MVRARLHLATCMCVLKQESLADFHWAWVGFCFALQETAAFRKSCVAPGSQFCRLFRFFSARVSAGDRGGICFWYGRGLGGFSGFMKLWRSANLALRHGRKLVGSYMDFARARPRVIEGEFVFGPGVGWAVYRA